MDEIQSSSRYAMGNNRKGYSIAQRENIFHFVLELTMPKYSIFDISHHLTEMILSYKHVPI